MIDEYQDFALGNFLCEWNQDVTFGENLEALTHDNCELDIEQCAICAIKEEIIIWEPFEYHPREYVAEQIENMHDSVKRRFIPREVIK